MTLPIVEFHLTQGRVCVFPDEYDVENYDSLYPLLKRWKNQGCDRSERQIEGLSPYDNRWEKAYSQPELEVINRNTDWRKAIDGLPGYDLDLAAETDMNLYYRPYIEWELHCENDGVTYEQIADANNPVNTISSIQLFNMVLSFLCLLVMGLIAPFFIVYKQCRTLAGSPESVKDSIASNGM